MPTRFVTYAHRPKRPPRKRKAAVLEVPAVVRKRSRSDAALPRPAEDHPTPANDDRKPPSPGARKPASAATAPPRIVTAHRRNASQASAPTYRPRNTNAEVTQDALFRELVRRATKDT